MRGADTVKSVQAVQNAVLDTYRLLGTLSPGIGDPGNENRKLEAAAAQYEHGVILLREYCERSCRSAPPTSGKPKLPPISITGKASVNEYGWLHIKLNTLLPHCRYAAPAYLTNTITRLLDEYESRGRPLPRFGTAILIIDEHCDIDSRTVFDQDNKGFKAVPNALKGRVIPDDDQFTLHVCLLSTRSVEASCHIWLLPQSDAGDFFYMKSENMLIPP